ncbi:MAG TPA: LuxR C-terminal-related transcriptional regulator [Lacisediminihabitans sp.]|uniref:helix-turn-helix transcriptional regulator n=1 Tax=Lacisediminihabitans sp. TaxID=2787631 RepID=UPI002ED94DFD
MTCAQWRDLVHRGGGELRSLILSLPYSEWSSSPSLLVAVAVSYRGGQAANPYSALSYLNAATRILDEDEGSAELGCLALIARSVVHRQLGRFSTAMEDVRLAIRRVERAELDIPTRIDLYALGLIQRGICELFTEDLPQARADITHAMRLAETTMPAVERVEAFGCLTLIDVLCGGLRSTERNLNTTADAAVNAPAGLWDAPATIASVLLTVGRCRFDELGGLLDTVLVETKGTEYEVLALHTRVFALETLGDLEGAQDALHDMRQVDREWEAPNLSTRLYQADRIEVLMRFGQLAHARQGLAEMAPDPQHLACNNVLAARLAMELGDFEEVVRLTADCLGFGDDHPPRTQSYAAVINAAAHSALGDLSTADASFERVLQQARASGMRRHFTVLPPAIITGLVERARERTESTTRMAMLDDIAAVSSSFRGAALRLLSPRERVVLSHVAIGENPREISASLSVSLNTVKTQLRSVYRKLGVSTRDGAVHRARVLGLLTAA